MCHCVRNAGKHKTLPVLLGEKLIEQKVKTNELVGASKVKAADCLPTDRPFTARLAHLISPLQVASWAKRGEDPISKMEVRDG